METDSAAAFTLQTVPVIASPMYLDQYHADDHGKIRISPEQASRFAKRIAGDFNPIHNPDAKRFCVPGDLLFSLVLAKYGVSERMQFNFSGMVGQGVELLFPETDDEAFTIRDLRGKTYLEIERAGEIIRDAALIEAFSREYVAFSGRNFPHILVPLMAEHGVMINPERPLIIYESMSFQLQQLDLHQPHLELTGNSLQVKGKRGDARLEFSVIDGGKTIGQGVKKLVLSGLREYRQDSMQQMVDEYMASKTAFA